MPSNCHQRASSGPLRKVILAGLVDCLTCPQVSSCTLQTGSTVQGPEEGLEYACTFYIHMSDLYTHIYAKGRTRQGTPFKWRWRSTHSSWLRISRWWPVGKVCPCLSLTCAMPVPHLCSVRMLNVVIRSSGEGMDFSFISPWEGILATLCYIT